MINSTFSRKPDSKLTEEQFKELDYAVFDILEKVSP